MTPTPDTAPPTAEELEARRQAMHKTMFGQPAPAVATPALVAAPAVPAPAAPEPPPVPAPAAPATPAPQQQPIVMATEQDLQRVADEAARRAQPATPVPQTPAAPQPVALPRGMTTDDKRDYEVVKFLERTQPAKYAGKAAQFLQFHRDLEPYRTEWESKNPEGEFNINDEAHNEWCATHQPGVEEEEIDEAKEACLEDKVAAKLYKEKIKPKEDADNAGRSLHAAMPGILANVQRRDQEFIRLVNPDLVQYVSDSAGNPNFSDAALAALKAADPIAMRHLNRVVVGMMEPLLIALGKSMVTFTADEGELPVYPLDASKPVDRDVLKYIRETEQAILSGPAEGRTKNGLKFTTFEDYHRRTNSGQDKAAVAAFDREFFTMENSQIEEHILKTLVAEAKRAIDEDDNLAKTKYGQTPAPRQPPTPPPTSAPVTPPAPTNGKPNSPSTAGTADVSQPAAQIPAGQKSNAEKIAEVHYRK